MLKFWTMERVAIAEKLALVCLGIDLGFSWAALAVRGDGSITVERFTELNWIAAGILWCGVIGWNLARRQMNKAARA